MYCMQCGKPIADGSDFCVFCGAGQSGAQPGFDNSTAGGAGASDGPASAPEGEAQRAVYTPDNMHEQDEAKPVTGRSSWPAWVLAALPVVLTAAMMILIPVSLPLALIVWALMICANAALYVIDMKQFPERAMHGWGWLAIVLPVVYLYIRAAKLDKQFGPAILRTVLIFVCFTAFCGWGVFELVKGAVNIVRNWDGSLPFGFSLPFDFELPSGFEFHF